MASCQRRVITHARLSSVIIVEKSTCIIVPLTAIIPLPLIAHEALKVIAEQQVIIARQTDGVIKIKINTTRAQTPLLPQSACTAWICPVPAFHCTSAQ